MFCLPKTAWPPTLDPWHFGYLCFLKGLFTFSGWKCGNNRSVMPLDVLGCTRATLTGSKSVNRPGSKGLGNLLKLVVTGIDHSNYWS